MKSFVLRLERFLLGDGFKIVLGDRFYFLEDVLVVDASLELKCPCVSSKHS